MAGSRSKRQLIGQCTGMCALLAYLLWNTWWLGHGHIPPSMLLKLGGIPAPTTGMTRSWVRLLEGQTVEGLLWNPLAVPLTILYAATLGWFVCAVVFRGLKPNLPSLVVKAWAILLPAAWCIKLLQGPSWW